MVVVIRETYKIEAVIFHALSDEEYKEFLQMTASQRFDFFKDKDRTMSQEELYPIVRSSKFKKVKFNELSEDMKKIAYRMTD